MAYMLNESSPREEKTYNFILKGGESFSYCAPPPEIDLGPRPLIVTETSNPKLPTAVIYRDSFSTHLIPFLARHFRKAYFIWNSDPNLYVFDFVKPDVGLHIKAERFILNQPQIFNSDKKFTWHDGIWRNLVVHNHCNEDISFRSIQHRTQDGDPKWSSSRKVGANQFVTYDLLYLGKFSLIIYKGEYEKFRLIYRVEKKAQKFCGKYF